MMRRISAIRVAARREHDGSAARAIDERAREMALIAADVALCTGVLSRVVEMPRIANPTQLDAMAHR